MLEHYIAVTSVPVPSTGQSYDCGPASHLQPSVGGPLYQWKRGLRQHTLRLSPRPAQLWAFAIRQGTTHISGLQRIRPWLKASSD